MPNRGLLCPACGGDSFSERSSFQTASEPLLGAPPSNVVVDLMACARCGADFPAVRGRRRYALLGQEKLAALLADLEEAKRTNSEMLGLVSTMERRSRSLGLEIDRCRARGEVSVMEARVAALQSETAGLATRRDTLARTVQRMAAGVPVRSV